MNEILYADSDTDHFKLTSNTVWVLASQPITQQTGSVKQVSLPNALQTAVHYKHKPLTTKKRTIRFVTSKAARPKMVQASMQASRVSSLSKALKKGVQIKNGRCIKKIGPKIVEGTTVWTLTPSAPVTEEPLEQLNGQSSSFAAALARFVKEKQLPLINESNNQPEKVAPQPKGKLLTVRNHTYNSLEAMAPTA